MEQEQFKVRLETELAQVKNELENIATLNPTNGDWVATPVATDLMQADPNLESDGVEEWNERRAVLAQLEIRYQNIKRALNKIEDKSYGVCEISGQEIEIERLKANPAARTNMVNIDREAELPL